MYKWNIKEIDELYKKYKKMADSSNNIEIKRKYTETCDYLIYLLEYYFTYLEKDSVVTPYDNNVPSFRAVIKDDLKIIKGYGMYAPLFRNFNNQFDGLVINNPGNLQHIKTSPTGIVDMSNSFFQNFKGKFYGTYSEIAKKFPTHLQFRKLSNNYDSCGNTHIVRHTKMVYIDIGKNNTLQDYISHIHESSHAISALLNPEIMWDYNKYCFNEVDSLFFEMIGIDYVGTRINREDDALAIKRDTFIDYLYCAMLVCVKLDMYNTLNRDDLSNKKKVKCFYKKELDNDKVAVNNICTTYIHEMWHYVISYLTAVELYYIYMKDEEKALDLLYKIIMLKGLSKEEYLNKVRELGIRFGEHIKDYYNLIFEDKIGKSYGKKI